MGTVADVVVACVLAALLIVGGYQIYFLPRSDNSDLCDSAAYE